MDKAIFDEMIATRRHLHTIPEEGWTEFETTYLVAERLKKLGYTDIRLGTQIINPKAVLGRNEETVQKASGADVNICSSCVFIYGQVTKSINCYTLSTAAGGNNHYSRVLERDITCCPFYKHSGV